MNTIEKEYLNIRNSVTDLAITKGFIHHQGSYRMYRGDKIKVIQHVKKLTFHLTGFFQISDKEILHTQNRNYNQKQFISQISIAVGYLRICKKQNKRDTTQPNKLGIILFQDPAGCIELHSLKSVTDT